MSLIMGKVAGKFISVYNTETAECEWMNLNKTKEHIDIMNEDEDSLGNAIGAVVFKDTKHKLYGVMHTVNVAIDAEVKLLNMTVFNTNKKKYKIANLSNMDRLEDVDTSCTDYFIYTGFDFNEESKISAKEKYESNKPDESKKESTVENKEEAQKVSKSDSNKQDKIVDLVSKLDAMRVVDKVDDIETVVSFNDEILDERDIDTNELVYEQALRVMSKGNKLTIPKSMYSKCNQEILKIMDISLSGDRYEALMKLKFNREDSRYIICIAEYDEDKQYTDITVVKSYGKQEMSRDELVGITMSYSKWKKDIRSVVGGN